MEMSYEQQNVPEVGEVAELAWKTGIYKVLIIFPSG